MASLHSLQANPFLLCIRPLCLFSSFCPSGIPSVENSRKSPFLVLGPVPGISLSEQRSTQKTMASLFHPIPLQLVYPFTRPGLSCQTCWPLSFQSFQRKQGSVVEPSRKVYGVNVPLAGGCGWGRDCSLAKCKHLNPLALNSPQRHPIQPITASVKGTYISILLHMLTNPKVTV